MLASIGKIKFYYHGVVEGKGIVLSKACASKQCFLQAICSSTLLHHLPYSSRTCDPNAGSCVSTAIIVPSLVFFSPPFLLKLLL
jgi:hypothetical protein